jgi:hypothetical protein
LKNLAFLTNPKTVYKIVIFKIQAFIFNKIIKSKNAWLLFDKAGIPGFGTNLIRLYFPPYYDKKASRESFSEDLKKHFITLIDQSATGVHLTGLVTALLPEIAKLPVTETTGQGPYLDNYYFGIYDAAVLGAIMQHFKPGKIIEVGSGISTRYMRLFTGKFALNTEITCIDPVPRAEIEGIADKIIREPFELVIENNRLNLQSGDIAFLDGSHYVFQGNDTLTFFFKFLPALPVGVIIHIHDIYLPFDYAPNVSPQLWNEQYLLAVMLMGGLQGFEILYAGYYLSQTNQQVISGLAAVQEELKDKNFSSGIDHTKGYSFWIRKTTRPE